jgi:hypothetical protein
MRVPFENAWTILKSIRVYPAPLTPLIQIFARGICDRDPHEFGARPARARRRFDCVNLTRQDHRKPPKLV